MDAEIKKKWLEALRSGKYEQTQRHLCKDGKYCCLGVLCDIIDNTKWSVDFKHKKYYNHNHDSSLFNLPGDLGYEIGLSLDNENILTNKNDNECLNFNQIADYIEENL